MSMSHPGLPRSESIRPERNWWSLGALGGPFGFDLGIRLGLVRLVLRVRIGAGREAASRRRGECGSRAGRPWMLSWAVHKRHGVLFRAVARCGGTERFSARYDPVWRDRAERALKWRRWTATDPSEHEDAAEQRVGLSPWRQIRAGATTPPKPEIFVVDENLHGLNAHSGGGPRRLTLRISPRPTGMPPLTQGASCSRRSARLRSARSSGKFQAAPSALRDAMAGTGRRS